MVELKDYEASVEGMIKSYTEYRVKGGEYDSTLETLWNNDRHLWK